MGNMLPIWLLPLWILIGRLSQRGRRSARATPVGVVIDKRGALRVVDDVGNIVWRVSAAP